ncbi:MAG: caspase family protein, partial [Mariprofundaceae bacterium]
MPLLAEANDRIALVIGNSAYTPSTSKHVSSSLKHAATDAAAIKTRLQALGFSVISRTNLARKDVASTLKVFRQAIKPGATVFFYYSGHAIQIQGTNYLLPVDFSADSGKDLIQQGLNLNAMAEMLSKSGAASSMLFVDASHKIPLPRKIVRGVYGPAMMKPLGKQMLISFANRPGNFTKGRSLYSKNLLLAMQDVSTSVDLLIQQLGERVKTASKRKQRPWVVGHVAMTFAGKRLMPFSDHQQQNSIAAKAGDLLHDPILSIPFVYIEPGRFLMGSPESETNRYSDEIQHQVEIKKGFWMGKYEITFAQYDAFCKATRQNRPKDSGWGRGNRPVTSITWFN